MSLLRLIPASEVAKAQTEAAKEFQETHVRNTGYPVSQEALNKWYPRKENRR